MKKIFLSLMLIAASYMATAQQTIDPTDPGSGGGGGEDCYKYIKGKRVDRDSDIYCLPPYDQNCFVLIVPCPPANPARTVSSDAQTILRLPFSDKSFVDIPIKANYKIERRPDGSTKLSYEID